MPSPASPPDRLAALSQTATTARPLSERDSGVYQTSPGLLRRRALGPWAEGLAQYLAIRLGDEARGRAAYGSLVRMLGALPPDELVRPPGSKAQLYRLARFIADNELALESRPRRGEIRWRERDGKSGRDLARLRAELGERDAELIELRHARELSVEEIACVLETPADEVELALDTAEARARQVLGAKAPDPLRDHATVYVEAFALARSFRSDEALRVSDPEDAALELGTLIGGRYQLVERVGSGAFGDVYRVEDIEVPGHQAALKLLRQPSLSESARRAALRELKLNAAVFHPSLVQFKDHGWFEQRLWFVMPWYEGETLEARMRRGALPRREARRIFEPLSRALAALHSAGIRHQDIKPENILLTRLHGYDEDDDQGLLPVLIDLGVAAEEQETLLGGTPLYFAPEVATRFVAEGHQGPDVGTAADVFALALSLRNALEPDTREDVVAGAIRAFVERRAVERPALPEARDLRYLRAALGQWMSLDPDERPTASELAEALSVLTAPEERRARRGKLLRWLTPLLVTLATVFAAVVYLLDQRAAVQETTARRAQLEAAGAQADLIVLDARRRALEEGHAELLDQFEQGRMSRRELAGQLATTEGQLRILRGDLASALDARDTSRAQLTRAQADVAAGLEALRGVTQERDQARERSDATARELVQTQREAAHRAADADALRARAESIGALLEAANTRARTAEDRAAALDDEVRQATRQRDQAEAELNRVRAQIRAIAEAAAPRAAPPSEPTPPPSAQAAEIEPPTGP